MPWPATLLKRDSNTGIVNVAKKMNVAKSLRAPFFYWTPPVNFIIDFITINNVFEQLFYRTPPVNFIINFITINNV